MHRPGPLEIVSGMVFGLDRGVAPLPRVEAGRARAALDRAVVAALRRPPCLVSFSGGRDSSIVLAAAVAVARREGLAPPVPITYRFGGLDAADEDAWQELVVAHLAISDWERVSVTTELDVLGPAAREVLTRHGPLWPFNAHAHVPLLERARGGSLLTGIGGDALLEAPQWRSTHDLLARRRRPRPKDVLSAGLALAPAAVRSRVIAARHPLRTPWAQPGAELAIRRAWAAFRASVPFAWDDQVAHYWQSRPRTVLSATMALLAADCGAAIVDPFLDAGVVAATAATFGSRGPASRKAAMVHLFGDLLPRAVLQRRSKARFDEAFVTSDSRAFVATWDGTGVDASLVDPARLRSEWGSERPSARSLLQLQAAWLGGRARTSRAGDG